MKYWPCILLSVVLMGCQTSPSGVADKVLADFGLKERPEGYVSATDQVMKELDSVGQAELDRLNRESRLGEVKFQEDGLRGLYYKEVKRYLRYRPLDAQVSSSGSQRDNRGFTGYIEYTYRVFQSERRVSRTEAAAEQAEIGTQDEGREVYRYRFDAGGRWDGDKGERSGRD